MASNDYALDVAAKAVSFNVLLQFLLRVSSFALNGFVLRFVQADLLGVVNLRLTLLYSTILFLSREPLRKAALTNTNERRQWIYTFNLMWLAVPIGGACSLILSLVWISPLLQQPELSGDWMGVAFFSLSSLIELTAEPLWVLSQLTHHVSIKVIAEGVPQVFRCTVVAVGVVFYSHYGILIFAMGQLTYSLLYATIYYTYFTLKSSKGGLPITNITHILPRAYKGKWQSPDLLQLSKSFFKQSILKQLLTDGERYIMTLLGLLTFAEQGVYDIVNNLGSLVARFIFQPIEETFYIYFSSVLLRGESSTKQSKDIVVTASTVLSLLLKLVTLIALVIVVFGYSYAELALDIYGGRILSQGSGPLLLRFFCLYVFFLALNGVTECFMFSAMSKDKVERYNGVMLVFSVIFLLTAVLLIHLFGSVGFILANCINMTTRIVHSMKFINDFFNSVGLHPLMDAIPSVQVWLSLTFSWIATALSMNMFCCYFGSLYRFIHILSGCFCLLLVGVVILYAERYLCLFMYERLPKKFQKLLQTTKVFDPQKIKEKKTR